MDLKNDKEFHCVTIKSKTLICHFNQNTPVRPSIRSSIHPSIHPSTFAGYEMPKMGTKWSKGYEMTWVRIDHHIVISYPVDLGTKWPKWVRNDLGTKWLLLDTKWPKSRYEMTKVGTKWPGYEMIWVRNDWQPKLTLNPETKWTVVMHLFAFPVRIRIMNCNWNINGCVSDIYGIVKRNISCFFFFFFAFFFSSNIFFVNSLQLWSKRKRINVCVYLISRKMYYGIWFSFKTFLKCTLFFPTAKAVFLHFGKMYIYLYLPVFSVFEINCTKSLLGYEMLYLLRANLLHAGEFCSACFWFFLFFFFFFFVVVVVVVFCCCCFFCFCFFFFFLFCFFVFCFLLGFFFFFFFYLFIKS